LQGLTHRDHPWPAPPTGGYSVTIRDLIAACDPEAFPVVGLGFARAALEAWSPNHSAICRWLDEPGSLPGPDAVHGPAPTAPLPYKKRMTAGERERELGRRLSELAHWASEAGFQSVDLQSVFRHGGDDPAGVELRIALDDWGAGVLVAAIHE